MENNADGMNATANMQQSSIEVTSSSPTEPSSSGDLQSYQQQLQDAMLAAVNSHSLASLSSQSIIAVAAAAAAAAVAAAAAAAAAAATNNSSTTTQLQQQHRRDIVSTKAEDTSDGNSNNFEDASALTATTATAPIDHAKRENIRAANRERKKKWRIHNEERNKDNDLRCRVNKRATKLFGPGSSEAKHKWAEEEFEKRRQKRMDKERRKNMVDTILSNGPISPTIPNASTDGLTSANPGVVAVSSMQESQQAASGYYVPTAMDTAAAAKMLDFPPELQRQLLEQLNNMIALTTANSTKLAAGDFLNHDQKHQTEPMDIVQEEASTEGNQQSPVASRAEPLQEDHRLSTGRTSCSTSGSNSARSSPVELKYETIECNDSMPKTSDHEEENKKKPEYPMDAVLTLMQLNAGWRQ